MSSMESGKRTTMTVNCLKSNITQMDNYMALKPTIMKMVQ